jgi:hypothetical protein
VAVGSGEGSLDVPEKLALQKRLVQGGAVELDIGTLPPLPRAVDGVRVCLAGLCAGEELKATGAPIVAMCPICLGNLLRAGAQAEDLSTLVARYA